MRERIVFFRSYYNAIKRLPKEKRVEAFEAILDYALDGVESSEDPFIGAMLELMKPNIDRSNALSDSASSRGRKGGRPKANKSQQKQTEANESQPKPAEANKSNEKPIKVEEEGERGGEGEYTHPTPQWDAHQGMAQEEPSQKEQRFLKFWAAYPKKKSKESARKAFFKLNPSNDLLCQMLRAVERQATTEQWRRQGGQFIPYPATWLNGGCWEDQNTVEVRPFGRGTFGGDTPPEQEPPGATWRNEGFQSWQAYRQAYLAGEVRDRLWL